jgi:hypothetical protein
LALVLIVLARRLRPYFQVHAIKVLTEYPLKKILKKPDISRRMVNWAVEIWEFDIDFLPRMATKRQAVADFLVEFNWFLEEVGLPDGEAWVACVDGSFTKMTSGAGVVLINPEGVHLEFVIRLAFPTNINEAEYEAVIVGIEVAGELRVKILEVRSDSQVVAGHIWGEYEAWGEKWNSTCQKYKK